MLRNRFAIRSMTGEQVVKHAEFVILCQGLMASGEPYWAYVNIPAIRVKAFQKARRLGAFRLEDYGEILAWGQGADVPDEVKARMEREHGVNHGFESQVKTGKR